MKESSHYQPISDDDLKSSSEMEDDMLIRKMGFTRSRRTTGARLAIALAAVLALAIYTALVVSVAWGVNKESRRHGTRFLKCNRPAHKALASLASILIFASLTWRLCRPSAPANDYITYEPHVMEQWEYPGEVLYFGEPSEKIDHNWHNLFECMLGPLLALPCCLDWAEFWK